MVQRYNRNRRNNANNQEEDLEPMSYRQLLGHLTNLVGRAVDVNFQRQAPTQQPNVPVQHPMKRAR